MGSLLGKLNGSEVRFGPASIVGYLLSAAGILTTVAVAIKGSEHELQGPGKWAAILGVAAGVATNLGRQHQAASAPPLAAPTVSVSEPLAALAAEAQQNLAAMPADGVDSAAVPFSTL